MTGRTLRRIAALTLASALAIGAGCEPAESDLVSDNPANAPMCSYDEGEEMYGRYIAPLMNDQAAQSCNKCHDESMGLNVWDKGDACQTMACMIDKELINLDDPNKSRIIEFIEFGQPETGFDIQVEREYDGFMAWMDYGATCFLDACGAMTDPCGEESPSTGPGGGPGGGSGGSGAGGTVGSGSGGSTGGGDGGVWGDCAQSDVQGQFNTLVFPNIDGCKACHAEPGDPEFDNAKRWYHENDASLTLVDMIGHSGMFNTITPENSELITKPLHQGEIYSAILNATFYGEEHEGGQKLTPSGMNFQARFDNLVTFLDYFANCHD